MPTLLFLASLRQGGKTALMKAAQKGFKDVVTALLEKGANIDKQADVRR